MRRLALALAVLVLPLAASPAHAAGDVVLATGNVTYDYWTESPTLGVLYATCAGEGPATVTFEPYSRRVTVSIAAEGCTPVSSVFTSCRGGDDAPVTCTKPGLAVTVDVDGTFSYEWVGSTFTERASGALVRA